MIKIILTLVISFLIVVPFLATPMGEQLYLSYQETELYRAIYCKYVDWIGAEGFEKLKYVWKCQVPPLE